MKLKKFSNCSTYLILFYRQMKELKRKQVFGYPSAFVNGNMFTGLFEENIIVKLDDEQREQWTQNNKAKIFEPSPGRFMKEYIVVSPELMNNSERLKMLVESSFNYAVTLNKKVKKVQAKKPK